MSAGLAGGTAISITLLREGRGAGGRAGVDTTWSMFFALAEANTSAGAPWVICCGQARAGAEVELDLVPGWAASNCLARVVNDSVSEAAANTVTVPVIAASDRRTGPRRPVTAGSRSW